MTESETAQLSPVTIQCILFMKQKIGKKYTIKNYLNLGCFELFLWRDLDQNHTSTQSLLLYLKPPVTPTHHFLVILFCVLVWSVYSAFSVFFVRLKCIYSVYSTDIATCAASGQWVTVLPNEFSVSRPKLYLHSVPHSTGAQGALQHFTVKMKKINNIYTNNSIIKTTSTYIKQQNNP